MKSATHTDKFFSRSTKTSVREVISCSPVMHLVKSHKF